MTPASAAAEWRSLRSEHFQLIGNASARELRDVALRFEQFRDIVTRLDSNQPIEKDDGSLVTILVFRDTKSFEPFMPRVDDRRLPAAGMFVAGPDATYIAVRLNNADESFREVFHEYSHLLLRRAFPDAPLWLDEGLAEYYSTLRITGSRSALLGYPILAHVSLLRRGVMPLARLFATTRDSQDYTDAATGRLLFYAQSWALVHHAFHSLPRRQDAIVALARRLAAGGDVAESLRLTYNTSLVDLEHQLQTYVSQNTYKVMSYAFREELITRLTGDAVVIRDAEADAWLGDLLVQMGRVEEGQQRLENAVRQQPDLGRAHAALALLLTRQNRNVEAKEHIWQAQTFGGPEVERLLARQNLLPQRRFTSLRTSSATAAAARPPGARPFLRITLADEQRSFGSFEALDCDGDFVEFVVRTPHGGVRARGRFDDVQMLNYRDRLDDVLCGAQPAQLPILLTWKPGTGDVANAIAVEFVPDGFVP